MQTQSLLFILALPALVRRRHLRVAGRGSAAPQPRDSGRAEALRIPAAAAQRRKAALPDPTVSLGYASNGPPWPGAGLGINPTSNVGVMVSQEMPFPGKRTLRGEIAGKEAEAAFDDYLAVRLQRGLAAEAGLPRTAPRHRLHRLHRARSGRAPQHAAHLRIALRGGARRAAGHLQGADATGGFRDRSCERYQQERDQPSRSKSMRCSNRPQSGAHRGSGGDDAPATCRPRSKRCWPQARAHAPQLAREPHDDPAQRTGRQPGAQRLLARLHPLRRLFQPGRHAAHVAGPRGFQAAGLFLAQAARRRRRAGIRRQRGAPQL